MIIYIYIYIYVYIYIYISIKLGYYTLREIEIALKSMKLEKASGINKIPTEL